MLKKVLFVGAAAALLLGLFFGRDAVSYVSTSWKSVRSSVRNSVPVEFEITRARDMIKDLDKPIRANMEAIARREVEVEKLASQIAAEKEQLATARNQILRLNRHLRDGSTFVYKDNSYTADQVKKDLANRFERFRAQESTTAKNEQILAAGQKTLDAAREKLNAMRSSRADLEVKVADLEARQKLVEVQNASSDFNIDDSQLSRTKELVEGIQSRIEVAEKLVNAQGKYNFEIPLDDEESVPENISEQITDYFGEGRADIEALVHGN